MVIQAIRYALHDSDETFDAILRPVIVDMLTTMLRDADLENRRLALTTLNAATSNKPALILPQLSKLLQYVVQNTEIDQSLIREVQMGPFKHKVDDGLEIRKVLPESMLFVSVTDTTQSAYETLRTLVNNAWSRLNPLLVFDRVVAGLKDEKDIKKFCNLMLTRLIELDADEATRRLDEIAAAYTATLSIKLKDNAVKQELEKQQEANKDVLRTTIILRDTFPHASNPSLTSTQHGVWKAYTDYVNKNFNREIGAAEEELRTQR